MGEAFDVIVIGARCAGSPLAMLLARAGHRVLVLDRAEFPSDTMSSHYLHPDGLARAKRWGILDRIAATGCPPISRWSYCLEKVRFSGAVPSVDGVAMGYSVRRYILDPILADAAVEAGAELRTRFVVDELLWDDDRVAGIRGRDAGGRPVEERARFVVGADGRRSFVAKSVGAPIYDEHPTSAFWYYTYFSGAEGETQTIGMAGPYAYASGRTNDDRLIVNVGGPRDRFDEFRADVEGSFYGTLAAVDPEFHERLRAAERTERFVGTGDLPGFYRKPWGPGWALAGDAGHHKDPITAGGIMHAWHQADLLARALSDALAGRRSEDEALGEYERERNEHSAPFYKFTCVLSRMAPVEHQIPMFEALANDPEQADRWTAMYAGEVTMNEFFSRENTRALMRAGGAR